MTATKKKLFAKGLWLLFPLFLCGQTQDTVYIDTLYIQSKEYLKTSPKTALESVNKVILQAQNANYSRGEAKGRVLKGLILYKYADTLKLSESRIELLEALRIYEKNKDTLGIALALDNLSVLEQTAESLNSALEYSELAIEYLEKVSDDTDDLKELGRAYNNKANIYFSQEAFETAQEWYEKAKKVCLQVGDREGANIALENLAGIYASQDSIGKALEIYKNLDQIHKAKEDTYSQIHMLYNMGKLYLKNEEFQKAISNFEEAKNLARNDYSELFWYAQHGIQDVEITTNKLKQRRQKKLLLIVGILALLAIITSYLFIRRAKKKTEELKAYRVQQEEETKKIIEEKEKETKRRIEEQEQETKRQILNSATNIRREIAMNIHGAVLDSLNHIREYVEPVRDQLILERVLQKNLTNALERVDVTYDVARNIAYELRPLNIDWVDRIKLSLLAIQKKDGIKTNLEFTETELEGLFSKEQGEKISTIACTLINNIGDHAKASDASVQIELKAKQELEMKITDNGIGFNPEKKSGIGLESCRFYTQELAGKMKVQSETGVGTSIYITIPISYDQEKGRKN